MIDFNLNFDFRVKAKIEADTMSQCDISTENSLIYEDNENTV